MTARPETSSSAPGRFLFVVPPLTGHLNPTIPLARELTRRGHEVAWTGHDDPLRDLLDPNSTFFSVGRTVPAEVKEREGQGRHGWAGMKATWEEYVIPVAHQMVPGIAAAVEAFEPDVLVVDQQALAGAAVAEARGLPWATSATTPAELIDVLEGTRIGQWLPDLMRAFMLDSGVPEDRARAVDPRKSPHLLIAYTTAALVDPNHRFPDHYALVGPSIGERVDQTNPFPWEWLDEEPGVPKVLVSLGTLNWRWGERFFQVAAEALSTMDVRAVMVVPDDMLPGAPPNVLLRPRIPQLALLPHLDAVVCHGGNNTVCETLAQGLPLVVSPLHDDQPMIADQVARAGAGLRIRFFRLKPEMLREALERVLTEPGFRAGAERVRASFEAAGGARAASDRLEALLGRKSVNKSRLHSHSSQ